VACNGAGALHESYMREFIANFKIYENALLKILNLVAKRS